MKQTVWFVLGWLVLNITAQAASFDCARASTKVEKLICADAELSKLDEMLSVAYKAALQDEKYTISIKQTQRLWMKGRNGCSDASCVKLVYAERLQTLRNLRVARVMQDTSKLSEMDKGVLVSKILSDIQMSLRPGPRTQEDVKFCNAFYEDFKQQRGIEYVEPKLRTDDYNHPELVKLRKQCPKMYFEEPAKCDVKELAVWLKSYEEDEEAALVQAENLCSTQFGKNEFALFELDYGNAKEYALYNSRKTKINPDELERMLLKLTDKDEPYLWNRRTNGIINVFFDAVGYGARNFDTCKISKIPNAWAGGTTAPESSDGIVKYAGKYITYNTKLYGEPTKIYHFSVGGVNPLCYYDEVTSK